jgi:hypothetical protein
MLYEKKIPITEVQPSVWLSVDPLFSKQRPHLPQSTGRTRDRTDQCCSYVNGNPAIAHVDMCLSVQAERPMACRTIVQHHSCILHDHTGMARIALRHGRVLLNSKPDQVCPV